MNKLILTLIRDTYNKGSTIGELYANGAFVGYTLEDALRVVKIKHETAIPEGLYKVITSISTRFGKKMPQVLNVPNFRGIRIHGGNTDENTSGCPLLGLNRDDENIWDCSQVNKDLIELIDQYEETFLCVVNYDMSNV